MASAMMNPRNEPTPQDSWYDRYGVYLLIVVIGILALGVAMWAGGFDGSAYLRPVTG